MKKSISGALLLAILFVISSCSQDKKAELEKIEKQISELEIKADQLRKELADANLNDSTSKSDGLILPVGIDTLQKAAFYHKVEVQGTVQSDENITITAEVMSPVTQILVKEGDNVSKGQTIIKLDAAITENSIAEVRNRLELAEITFEKQAKLWEKKVGTEMQYLQAKNQRDALRKQLSTLQAQLDKYIIKSPINGVIDDISVNIGENVSPGFRMIRVVNLSEVEIKAEVPESYVGKIKKGDSVSIKFPAISYIHSAKVTNVGQVISSGNRTFTVQVKFKNPDNKLKPNLLALLSFVDYYNPSVISIPSSIIISQQNQKIVSIAVKNSKGDYEVSSKTVVTGQTNNGITEILEGLNEGDLLITEGYKSLENGDLLKIVK